MDEKLARGLERQHVRNRLKTADADEAAAQVTLRAAARRIAGGRVITNPVAVMGTWRAAVSHIGASVVQAGHYRRAVAFRPAWCRALLDYKLVNGLATVERVDEEFVELAMMVDALEIDRKEMTTFCGAGALFVDRHALHRWLQRQSAATVAGFEAALLARLPTATVTAMVCSWYGDDSIGAVIPLGDGLLLGRCLSRDCSMADDEMPLGAWRRWKTGKRAETVPAKYLGTAREDRVGGHIFDGSTYFGPDEMNDDLIEVRRCLLDWEQAHTGALGFDWLGESALTNSIVVTEHHSAAFTALAHLYETDLWRRAVIDRSSRAIGRKLVA